MLLGALALAAGAAAQQLPEPPPAPAEAIPQYQVEIIVFGYRELDRSEERFDHRKPDAERAAQTFERRVPRPFESALESLTDEGADEGANAGGVPEDAPAGGPAPFRFRLLEPQELQLTPHYETLRRVDAYVPLVHAGWVQQGLPQEQARPFDLALLGALNPRGTVLLYLTRFLHVQVNLTYQDPTQGATPAPPVFGDRELRELELAPRYRLRAERQTRSGELHYFDHPAFGVLVLVTPLPADAVPVGPRTEPAA
jgi:hypothetical protein